MHGFAGPGGVSPASVDRDGNTHLIDAARVVGADVVLMSVHGAAADGLLELHRMKYAAEQYLRASGVSWTIVRATVFAELWIELLEQTARRSGRPLVFGRGDNPINFVAVAQVAALAELAVIDRSLRSRVLEVGRPDNQTFNQLAAAVQTAAGRSGSPRHVPRPVLRAMAATFGRFKPRRRGRGWRSGRTGCPAGGNRTAGDRPLGHPSMPAQSPRTRPRSTPRDTL